MKILLCCQWYAPSVGGVQKVIKEIAEELSSRGHDTTVATSFLETRTFKELNGVKIQEFKVSGNIVSGLQGDLKGYQNFLLSENFDAVLVYAAQQWTFDAMWPILSELISRKIHVPCGYSSYYDQRFKQYYSQMPDILKKFDHLIYNANDYRDINLAKDHAIKNYSVIPNGASSKEFLKAPVPSLRKQLGIDENDFIFLTVGSHPFYKGHIEAAQAYAQLKLPFSSTLILDGRYNPIDVPFLQPLKERIKLYPVQCKRWIKDIIKWVLKKEVIPTGNFGKALKTISQQEGKNYLITNLKRDEIISAFFISNLFVFASYVEYSPLVLFESTAAGLPFVSVPVGNAEEISKWTQCGEICPANKEKNGNTKVSVSVLSDKMQSLAIDSAKIKKLGEYGRKQWKAKYTWTKIVDQYEEIITGEINN